MVAVLVAVVAALFVGLGCVQFASAALLSRAGTPGSLPSRLPETLGLRIYEALERIAPAPFVESMLARSAFDAGDLATAERHALQLPASPARNEWLGRIAQVRGQDEIALEYFLVAPDVDAVQRQVERIASSDPRAAFALEDLFRGRLEALTTHPDAVADAYWRLGQLATAQAVRQPSQRTALLREGMREYRRAVDLAPLSDRYLLAAGSQALDLNDMPTARHFFQRGVDADPTSADAYAGLGLATLRLGDAAAAKQDEVRARSLDPSSRILHDLERALR
jgi:tetratricopeptide (TPR) repeat protein